MNFSLKSFKGKISANGQLDFNVYGDKVFAVNVPDGCKVKFDNGEAVMFRTGLRYGVNGWFVSMLNSIVNALSGVPVVTSVAALLSSALGGNIFHKISVVNENFSEVDVELLAGFGDISDDSTIVENTVNANVLGTVSSNIANKVAVKSWSVRGTMNFVMAPNETRWLGGMIAADDWAILRNMSSDYNLCIDTFSIPSGGVLSFPCSGGFSLSASGEQGTPVSLITFKQAI